MTKHDKSRNTRNTLPLSHSLTLSLLTCWTTQKSLCHSQSHSVTHNLALSQSSHSLNPHTHSILTLSQSSQSLNLSFYQSLIHLLLTCRTTFVFMSMLKSHSPTLSFIQPWHAEPCVCSYEPNWKNVWKSDKSWEPEKIWKFENFWKFGKIWKFEKKLKFWNLK